jgi:serine/threonine protein kinase
VIDGNSMNLHTQILNLLDEKSKTKEETKQGTVQTVLQSAPLQAHGYAPLGPPTGLPVFEEVEEQWEINFKDLRIGKVVGVGAFGSVKKAELNNKEVAVKFFHSDEPHDIAKFLQEIKLMW